jgi:hypothetical protein
MIKKNGQNVIDNSGELPYTKRIALLTSLGDKKGDANDYGYLIRSDIAFSCAKKTLYVWDKATEGSGFLMALEFAEKCLVNPSMHGELENVMNNMIPQVENILYENDKDHLPAYAGFSCVSALSTALYDEQFDFDAKSELEIEPGQWDSAFHSSLAIAGGAVWERDVVLNNIARREFWEWYLDVAIPNAIRKYS